MVHTQEEIIKALQVIKDECRTYFKHITGKGKDCTDCPFSRNNGGCRIVETLPTTWDIKPIECTWKAFRED